MLRLRGEQHNVALLVNFIDDEVTHQVFLDTWQLGTPADIFGDAHRLLLEITDWLRLHWIFGLNNRQSCVAQLIPHLIITQVNEHRLPVVQPAQSIIRPSHAMGLGHIHPQG